MQHMNVARFIRKKGNRRQIAACALCVLLAGVAVAGWQFRQATDTTTVDAVAMPDDLKLQDGDIIVAGGVSLQSRMVRSLTDDNTYSHVGLIEVTPQGVFVIHASPEGDGDGGVGDRVGRIPLSLFLSERGYVAVRVMRLNMQTAAGNQAAENACAFAARCIEQAVPFDPSFDLTEHERMYCSELVYLAYQQAGYDWPDALMAEVSTLVVDGPIILPDAFVNCSDFKTIWQY